jgi:hypothetical protein
MAPPAKRDIVSPNECRVTDEYANNHVDFHPHVVDTGESVMNEPDIYQVERSTSRRAHVSLGDAPGVRQSLAVSQRTAYLDRPTTGHLVNISDHHA